MVQAVIKVVDGEVCIQDDAACVCAVCCPDIASPDQVFLVVEGMADDTCTDCEDFDATYVLDYVGVFDSDQTSPPSPSYAVCIYSLTTEPAGELCDTCTGDGLTFYSSSLIIDFSITNNNGTHSAGVSFEYGINCQDPMTMGVEGRAQFNWDGSLNLGAEEACTALEDKVFTSLTGSGTCDGSSATITISAVTY